MKAKGPQFIRFLKPIIEVLRESGGSGTSSEVTDKVIERLNIPDEEQSVILKSGQSRVYNQVHWARMYLVSGGILDSSKRGVWTLTEEGNKIDLGTFDSLVFFKTVAKRYKKKKAEKTETQDDEMTDEQPDEHDVDYGTDLLEVIKSLPPAGFERLCQRLLRENGFEQVTVTGKSGDGGIDGIGILQVNKFVSFTVLFQCKRYQGSVTPSQVRDFRGAMEGRADKGIIITTGVFTVEAKKEARRDGAKPIELVNGDDLVELFESLELGVTPRTTYEVDQKFFDEYRT
ncbi:MAG: restriction endonuclease [Planctomycetaceae bacterium]|nr:restriction endonuclease [Planctomycetales bacterium]MCB9924382.1 restriction endonuclease [Planctomycetaceae bacterium]